MKIFLFTFFVPEEKKGEEEMGLNMRNFADILASKQGGIYLKPGRAYKRVLSRAEVIEIFGDVPEYSVRYGLRISVNKLDDDNYEVTVKRSRN